MTLLTRNPAFAESFDAELEQFEQAQIEAFHAERLSEYRARGLGDALAEENATADCRAHFRDNAYSRAIMGLFENAMNGGADFIVKHRGGAE